jgi:hypothetical protein
MKIKNLYFWVFIIIGAFFLSGCYTQLKLEDDDYAYKKERKRVIIEKRVEERDGETVEFSDTTYESTDDYGYEEDEDHYYYPRHRRSYKFYHPGITIVVGGAVYYDPWYFDYFYYPYTICRTYYLPWWYGYCSCYRVWYGFAYYDPFYNPFYAPPYWWYDPYWYGGYYPPIVQYRKNDYTRLRDQDGGRSGLVRTGNWGRDLNIQVASERTKMRDIEGSSIRTNTGRERDTRIDTDLKVPTTRDRGATIDRDTRTTPRTQEKPNTRKENVRDRDNNRNSPPSIDRSKTPTRTPDRTPDTRRERIDERPKNSPDRNETPSSRRFDSYIPNLEQKVIIERNTDYRNNDLPSKKNDDSNLRNYRNERIRIEYEIPRREYTPRFEERRTEQTRSNDSNSDENVRNSSRIRNEVPSYNLPRRTETPRYEPPRFDPPSRTYPPSFTPSPQTPPPSRTPSTSGDRGRDR